MGELSWAIVDFPGPDGKPRREILPWSPVAIEARAFDQVRSALDMVEDLARSGFTMVGYVAYDAVAGLDPKFELRSGYDTVRWPSILFLGFKWSGIGWSEPPTDPHLGRFERWSPDFDPDRYRGKVAEIIEGIHRGDHYQVNLTERYKGWVDDPLATYERLRTAQRAPYSVFIQTEDVAVLSVSPELFLHRSGNTIESRPMKGTSRRGRWSEEDDDLARALAASEKERAENVMIVDLVRNDMGRVAVTGSVEVPSMFTVERYPTVLQMTSHVRSQLKPDTSLADIFTALFPCGSVTGAPKLAAAKSIAALEDTPRGVYCGAVGIVRPGGTDFTFNVAIRTVWVDRRTGGALYGSGGGVTADSDPDQELAELQAKAAVLTSMPQPIELSETLRIEAGEAARLELHLDRLSRSAAYFGFATSDGWLDVLRSEIESEAAAHPEGVHRLRVVVGADGDHSITIRPHDPESGPRRLRLSKQPVSSSDRHLYHKLADRSRYDHRMSEARDADDVVLVNERGEITETTIGNLVLELDGRCLTPALPCGLLPGVYRRQLLEAGEIAEAVLRPDDLERASRVWMINSLRGWVPCTVLP